MDFIHDQLATGPKLRILTVVDTFSRFSPAVVPRFSFRAPDVVEVLKRVLGEVGYWTHADRYRFETSLLGPVLDNRICGDCTVCCTVLKVDAPEFRKPAETPCTHLASSGCSIHAIRPRICRTSPSLPRHLLAMTSITVAFLIEYVRVVRRLDGHVASMTMR